MHDHALMAVQHIAVIVRLARVSPPPAGRNGCSASSCASTAIACARGQRRQHGHALVGVAERGDGAGSQHRACQIGFQHQPFAQRPHHQHGIDRAAAETAVLFRYLQGQQAQIGETLPGGAAEAIGRLRPAVAPGFEAEVLGNEAARGFQQHLLFFAESEIHVGSWCCSIEVECGCACAVPSSLKFLSFPRRRESSVFFHSGLIGFSAEAKLARSFF